MRQTTPLATPAPHATPAPRPAAVEEPSSVRDVIVPAVGATLVTLLLTGLLYPIVMTGIAKVLFPARAEGSLVQDAAGNVVGSSLLAQGFAKPVYFQPRPSASGLSFWSASSRPAAASCSFFEVGPRFEPPEAIGSKPLSPAADGRGWK